MCVASLKMFTWVLVGLSVYLMGIYSGIVTIVPDTSCVYPLRPPLYFMPYSAIIQSRIVEIEPPFSLYQSQRLTKYF